MSEYVWIAVRVAATRAGVSERTITNWIHRGRLVGRRVGPRLLQVRLDSLEQLFKEAA